MTSTSVPVGWKRVRTTDVLSGIITGKKDVNEAAQSGDYPFFSCARETSMFSNEFILDTDTILISGNGSYTGFIKSYSGKFDLYQRTYALHDFNEDVNWRYVYYVFKYFFEKRFMGGTTGAAIPYITKPVITSFEFFIPEEKKAQDRIASVLSAYDDQIENNRRRIQLLEQSARLLYKEWFVHLRFPGHEHVKVEDGVPQGWENTFLPDVIEVNPTTPIEKGKEVWYVPMSALSEQGMTAEVNDFERRTVHTAVRFKKNDVLLARITPCLENGKTGLAYFLGEDEVACGSTEFIVLRGTRVSYAFTYCLARSYPFRGKAIKSMIGSSGRQRVQVSCFNEYKVPLPPKHLQEMFDEITQRSFLQIGVLVAQNDRLSRARDLLLPRLMTGEVAV